MPFLISSLQHPQVKYFVRLRKEKSFRREEKKILIMGNKIIQELLSYNIPFDTLLCLAGQQPPPYENTVFIAENVLKKITGQPNPEPLAALVPIPSFQSLINAPRVLILDQVTDPGNLGSLLRSALALGWDGVFLSDDCCDPFNDKALRAAKGATFRIPLEEGKVEDFILKNSLRQLFLADIEGLPLDQVTPSLPYALLLSNESRGPTAKVTLSGQKITIPMSKDMESLNVAAAGAILLERLKNPVFMSFT